MSRGRTTHLHNIRRTGGAALDVQGGHELRHVGGKEQWGIKQRAKKNGAVQSTVVWHDAPVIDADGRPTELLGLVNRGAPGPAPPAPAGGSVRSVASRVTMLEGRIAQLGVTRPQPAAGRGR